MTSDEYYDEYDIAELNEARKEQVAWENRDQPKTLCVCCSDPLESGDDVVLDHGGDHWHADCYKDSGCCFGRLDQFQFEA